MIRRKWAFGAFILLAVLSFTISPIVESSAWARAGGGYSFGSRGSRSFSAPSMPSRVSPSPTPGMRPGMGPGYHRNPFWSGLAGGIAGGFIGNLLFGGRAFGGPTGYRGGPGLLDLLLIGALVYFLYRLFVRRRGAQGFYEDAGSYPQQYGTFNGIGWQAYLPQRDEVERGLDEIYRSDPAFEIDSFLETVEDLFFRVQAAWMNRSLDGIKSLITTEMTDYLNGEFERMKQQHVINRLENIAVRKVEPAEVWEESGRDYITVLFTASLLDYTVDDRSGEVVDGDNLNPVKFQEFWTFSRGVGTSRWQLAGINQPNQPSPG